MKSPTVGMMRNRYFLAGALEVILAYLEETDTPEYVMDLLKEIAALLESGNDLSEMSQEET